MLELAVGEAEFPPPHAADQVIDLVEEVARLRGQIGAASIEAQLIVANEFSPSALARKRRQACFGLLGDMAADDHPCKSANAQANGVRSDLLRYSAGDWQRGDRDRSAPRDTGNVRRHRFLRLAGGEIPAARTIREALRGVWMGRRF